MSAADVLNVCFPLLRQQKTLNTAKIEAELEMLGLESKPDEIELAWASAQVSENLSDAIASLEAGAEEIERTRAGGAPQAKARQATNAEVVELASDLGTGIGRNTSEEGTMREVTDYKIIEDSGPSLVASQVQKAIKQGWQPQGSMSVYRGGTALGAPRDKYFQVIVKYK